MNTGNLLVARWVMLVETLGAFTFLTIGWFEVTLGASGLFHHSWEAIEKHLLGVQGGGYVASMWLAAAVIGSIGPLGLYLGLRYVLTGRGLRNRALGLGLVAILAVYAIAGGLGGYLVGPADFRLDPAMTLLFSVLPIVVILHLMYLNQAGGTASIAAASA